jgi:hypothetical protein
MDDRDEEEARRTLARLWQALEPRERQELEGVLRRGDEGALRQFLERTLPRLANEDGGAGRPDRGAGGALAAPEPAANYGGAFGPELLVVGGLVSVLAWAFSSWWRFLIVLVVVGAIIAVWQLGK